MSELGQILETLRRAAMRRRLAHALHGLWIGLLAGTGAWLAAIALHKVLPLPEPIVAWGWLAAILGAAAGFVAGGWRAVSPATAARFVESRQALDQRLSTALEVAARQGSTIWSQLVIADAARALKGVDVARLSPFALPAFARWIPVVLVLVVGLGFVPEYRSAGYRQRKKDAEIVRTTGRNLANLVRRELERREPVAEPVRDALGSTSDLGDRLSQAKLTKAEALQDLKSATQRLEEEARQLEREPALKKLQEAARSSAGGDGPANSEARKQLEKLQQSTAGATPDQLEKLRQKLQEVQQAASGMQGAPPDAAVQQALAQSLNQLAQSARQMGLNSAGLNQALKSLENLQIDRLLQDLKLAANDLDKLRDMAKKLAEMQSQMQQAGKDLAEQLERGQAEAAAGTLQKMVEQLQSAGLTPEQQERLIAELAKALDPAGQYGKVADLLKQAVAGLKSGEKGQAGKQLAAAAEELRKLAQQAQDMQQLADALAALEDAQLAITSGRAWQPGGT